MKAEQRKKQILAAALAAFAEHGYERTSVAVICAGAGVARPTLYQYFKDKQAVFRQLLEEGLLGLHDRLHQTVRDQKQGRELTGTEEMYALHLALLKEFAANRELYTIVFKEAKARNAETEDIVNRLWQGLTRKLVEEISRDPVVADKAGTDIEFMVRYMLGGLTQTVEHYLFDEAGALPLEELAEKMTAIEVRIRGI